MKWRLRVFDHYRIGYLREKERWMGRWREQVREQVKAIERESESQREVEKQGGGERVSMRSICKCNVRKRQRNSLDS